MISIRKGLLICSTIYAFAFCSQVLASTKSQLQALVPEVQSIAAEPSLVAAVAKSNQSHATLTKKEIRVLGKAWHAGLAGKPSSILKQVNESDVSRLLKHVHNAKPKQYAGLFVTDAKGLVIGQTYTVAHYSQASRAIWRKIAKKGVQAVYYGRAKKTAAGKFAMLGLPIVKNHHPIGAILVKVLVKTNAKPKKVH